MLNDYGGPKMLFANDIAVVEMNQELSITAHVMPICVDWGNSQPPLKGGDEGIVSTQMQMDWNLIHVTLSSNEC